MQLGIGVQTLNVIEDDCPEKGAQLLKEAGFTAADFSLHGYLTNKNIYGSNINHFFEQSVEELEAFFTPHKEALAKYGIDVWQMHMPYPVYVPKGSRQLNAYLRKNVAPKSMRLCSFLGCRYIVIHGFKLAYYLGSEEQEWQATQEFLEELAPLARELGITMCIENLYDSQADRIVEGPCCDAVKAARHIDAMNEKYGAEVLGFCFDTGHANLIHLDFEQFLTTLGYRLKVLHIHDNDGWRDLHQIPFAFTKTRENKSATDWEGFIRGLKKIGYKGVLNFETGPALTAFPDDMKSEALGFICRIGKYFAENIKYPKGIKSNNNEEDREMLIEEVKKYYIQYLCIKDVINVYWDASQASEKQSNGKKFLFMSSLACEEAFNIMLARLYEDVINDFEKYGSKFKINPNSKTMNALIKKCEKNVSLFTDSDEVIDKIQEFKNKLENEFYKPIVSLKHRRNKYYAHNDKKYFMNDNEIECVSNNDREIVINQVFLVREMGDFLRFLLVKLGYDKDIAVGLYKGDLKDLVELDFLPHPL